METEDKQDDDNESAEHGSQQERKGNISEPPTPPKPPNELTGLAFHAAVGLGLLGVAYGVFDAICWQHADSPFVWKLIPSSLSAACWWYLLHRRFILHKKNFRLPVSLACAATILAWASYFGVIHLIEVVSQPNPPPTQNTQPVATTVNQNSTGNNPTNINQSNQGGTNNVTINNNGITPEMFQAIKDGMADAERRQKDQLTKEFPMGYTLLTVADRTTIIPNESPIDKIIAIDWTSVNAIRVSDKSIEFLVPTITIRPPQGGFGVVNDCIVIVYRNNQAPLAAFEVAGYAIAFKYVEDLDGKPMLVMGIIQDPPTKP